MSRESSRTHGSNNLTALYHPLTGLPSEFLLLDRLAQAIPVARRRRESIALLLTDFDSFRSVRSDSDDGFVDSLLCMIARRLEFNVRESDTVAHLGDDRFAVGLVGLRRLEGATTVARKLCEVLAAPYDVGGREARLTASVGVALYPRDAATPETLLATAARSLRDAKAHGGNRFRVARGRATVSEPAASSSRA